MPNTSRPPRAGLHIVRDGVMEHRVGILAWVFGGGVFNVFETYALHVEFHDFVGGAQALAKSVLPALEAMRPIRWPADRIDTLPGYLTYHNVLMFQGFLAIYAAVQGVHLIRRPEEQHSLEQILATGKSRRAYFAERTVGLAITIALIALGLGASTAGALAFVGEPQTGASFLTYVAVALCALVAGGAGLLSAQVFKHTRTGIGGAIIPLVIVYVLTNEWENVGWLGVIRFISPFFYAYDGRALVPGIGFDWMSMTVLIVMSALLIVAAAIAFTRRDYAGGLWSRTPRQEPVRTFVDPQRWSLDAVWSATLVRHRIVLLAWALTTVAFSVLWMGLEPTVAESWAMSDFFSMFLGGPAGVSIATMYVSFGCDVLAPLVLAYSVSQASGWVADLHERRNEALLTTPLSWSRLMWERILAACVGVAVVAVSWLAAGVVMAWIVDADIDFAGYGRAFALCILLGWAGAALAAVLAAWTRNTFATTGLIIYIVIAYMLGWFVQVLRWPDWLNRLSVFEAYEHPYLEWPSISNLAILVGVGVMGSLASAWIAERTPKIAA